MRERIWCSPAQSYLRPRMRLVAAQAQDSATTVYGATFGSVDETGRARVLAGSTWSAVHDLILHVNGGQDLSKLRITEIMYRPADWLPSAAAAETNRITT